MYSVPGKADAQGRYRIHPYPGIRFGITAYPPDRKPYLTRQLPPIDWEDAATVKKVMSHCLGECSCVAGSSKREARSQLHRRRPSKRFARNHGAAGPVFLAGPKTKGGLVGTTPDLSDLEGGDIKMNIDLREIYAAILEDWLEVGSKTVLDGAFTKRQLFRTQSVNRRFVSSGRCLHV